MPLITPVNLYRIIFAQIWKEKVVSQETKQIWCKYFKKQLDSPSPHALSLSSTALRKTHTSYFNFLFCHSTNYIFQIQGPLCYHADQNKTFTKITHKRATTHITNSNCLCLFTLAIFSCHWLKISLALLLSMNFLQLPHKFIQIKFQNKSRFCPSSRLLSLCQHFTLNVNRNNSLAKMEPTKWTESL